MRIKQNVESAAKHFAASSWQAAAELYAFTLKRIHTFIHSHTSQTLGGIRLTDPHIRPLLKRSILLEFLAFFSTKLL